MAQLAIMERQHALKEESLVQLEKDNAVLSRERGEELLYYHPVYTVDRQSRSGAREPAHVSGQISRRDQYERPG
jgi:hypothetical protein